MNVSQQTTTVCAIYRHLLRATSHAVRHTKPVVKNVRRLLRDDYDSFLRTQPTLRQLEERAASALLLYLSSMHSSPPEIGVRARLARIRGETDELVVATAKTADAADQRKPFAHRVMVNLSSLCYHHLSPYTAMQPFDRVEYRQRAKARTANKRRQRALERLNSGKGRSAQKRRSGASGASHDDEEDVGAGMANSVPIPSLQVSDTRRRGPKIRTLDERTKSIPWDPQQSYRVLKPLEEQLVEATALTDQAFERYSTAKKRMEELGEGPRGAYRKECEEARVKAVDIRGKLKTIRGTLTRTESQQRIAIAASEVLAPIVQRAEARSNAWLGAARFETWRKGGWLAP